MLVMFEAIVLEPCLLNYIYMIFIYIVVKRNISLEDVIALGNSVPLDIFNIVMWMFYGGGKVRKRGVPNR